uniref:Chloride channel accessory 1 n=1 Tax=Erpetoichthys calabaricus TaxID=27687 RepID=A0A8C4T0Q8_ERPCA
MAYSAHRILFLGLCLLSGIKCSKVVLENNGYKNLVIAINPEVPENSFILTRTEEMVRGASKYLFTASAKRFYIKDVKILIPATWETQPNYARPKTESYSEADVIIAAPYMNYGNDPYTLQYGGCGEAGRYIHLTPDFLIDDKFLQIYGPRERVLVHEWAHLRWGVYDEYNEDKPFYFAPDKSFEATRCSVDITGIMAECKDPQCSGIKPCEVDQVTGSPTKKCQFFPDKKQRTTSSIMFYQGLNITEFCNQDSHNAEAPNMQNKMCKSRSVWEVIEQSKDFKASVPMNENAPPPTTFTYLQGGDRVICLVLDVSSNMMISQRKERLQQAAELFILQFIETGSFLGIVQFNSEGKILQELTHIEDDNSRITLANHLPNLAEGGLNICEGIRTAFRVFRNFDQMTYGDEIVLATAGEDNGLTSCMSEVKESGAIIHTIAIGPSAAKELEVLSGITGGLQFSATDSPDSNGLIDAFAGICSTGGHFFNQTIQLEIARKKTQGKDWLNGTVSVDRTVGNDTVFVVTWETMATPAIYVFSPSGQDYSADFVLDMALKESHLKIPGTAEVGDWHYNIDIINATSQTLTMTVTSRAASSSQPPVTVNAYMNKNSANAQSPIKVYAEVSKGYLPVLGAKVTAFIESDTNKEEFQLLDNGAGADIIKNDGVYSGYFFKFNGNGRYSLKVKVQGSEKVTKLSFRKGARAYYIPGYHENGYIFPNPQKPPVSEEDLQSDLGSFTRTTSGGVLVVTGMTGSQSPNFPPCQITDLDANIEGEQVSLSWTAPGEHVDQGTASNYEIRMSATCKELKDHFENAILINMSGLVPQEAGKREYFAFKPEGIVLKNGTIIYFAARAADTFSIKADISNIAQATIMLPYIPAVPEDPESTIDITSLALITVFSIIGICIIAGVSMCITKRKQRRRRRTAPAA